MPVKYDGPLTLAEIAAEFGGTPPYSLAQYYRLNGRVPNGPVANANIPTSGTIRISNFYGSIRSFSTCYEVSAPAGGTRTRTIAWDNSITHTVTLNFGTVASGDEYFLREGAIIWNGRLIPNGYGDGWRDVGWKGFLASIPNITFTASTWNSLTSTPQVIATRLATGYYQAAATVVITGTKVGAVVTLTTTFTEGTVNNTGSVVGDMSSVFSLRRASAACITPAIAYPAATSSGTM